MRLAPLIPAVFGLATVSPASSQVTPVTVPKGTLRWDFYGQFQAWEWRWRDGRREEAAADFVRSSVDRSFVPGLDSTEARIRRLTGLGQVNLSLGQSTASELVNVGVRGFGGAFGLTKAITIFGSVPIVSVKIEPRFLLDTASSNLGLNRASLGHGNVVVQLQLAASAIRGKLADPDLPPAERANLDALLIRVTTLEIELRALLVEPATAAYFLPTASSAAGAALRGEVQRIQTDLAAAGVTVFTASLNLPGVRASIADFTGFLTDPAGPIAGRPIDDTPYLIRMGDIEVGAAIALIDKFPASRLGRGVRATLDGTIRLRTAQLDRPDRFLDLGTGDRQPDVDLNLTTDIAMGRFGLRMVGGYNLQLPGNQNRRVAPPDQPIATARTQAGVRRDPGDVLRISARPFLRLATHLSLFGAVDFWTRQADKFDYAAGQPPVEGVDLSVLSEGTKSDALLLSGGLSYSHSGENKLGILKLPLDASVRYERIVRSGTGVLPDANTIRVDLRLYTRLWR